MWLNCLLSSTEEAIPPFGVGFALFGLTRTQVELLTVFVLQLLVIISPEPDFAIICRNSLVDSQRTGIYSSLGLALGILVHVTYSLVGIGLIISKSILVFSIIKLLGAAYLIYIGYKSLRAKPDTELKRQF